MLIEALFDKSFLQALNPSEAVWFDHFFYPVIAPLFYVETLADLEKSVRAGRTPEEEVGFIANKTPEMHGGPCAFHSDLSLSELLGRRFPLNHGIPVTGGRAVSLEGKFGVVFEQSPESKAFSRWQAGEFLQTEREFASQWREGIKNIDLYSVAESGRKIGIDYAKCNDLKQVKELAETIINANHQPYELMKLAFTFLNIPERYHRQIADYWHASGTPPLKQIFPYTSYVLVVELFFYIGLGADLLPKKPATNRIDMAYLFYLPFTKIFISGDNFHKTCAPYFLREDQKFIWGEDMKKSLGELNDHYSKFPDEEKKKGIMHFANRPPKEINGFVSSLWDCYCPDWRIEDPRTVISPEANKLLGEKLSRWTNSAQAEDMSSVNLNDLDTMSIERSVRAKRAGWYILPENIDKLSK